MNRLSQVKTKQESLKGDASSPNGSIVGARTIEQLARQAKACRACPLWLDAELALIEPEIIVCLGATAAQALLGRSFRVSAQRGQSIPSPLAPFVAVRSSHRSSILVAAHS